MRKWYGAGERPTDGGGAPEPEPEEPEVDRDVVLVTDADSPLGEQVVLQLILARQQLRLLVRDVAAAKTAYGPYASPMPAAAAEAAAAAGAAAAGAAAAGRLLRGVKALVVLGRPARGLLEAARAAGVKHVVLPTAAPGAGSGSGGGFSLGGLIGLGGGGAERELRQLGDGEVEAAVRASGLPYSVVQVYGLVDAGRAGGGGGAVEVSQRPTGQSGGGGGGGRAVSREALGAVVAGLIDAVPVRGRTLQAQGPSSGGGGSGGGSPQAAQDAVAAKLEGLAEDL